MSECTEMITNRILQNIEEDLMIHNLMMQAKMNYESGAMTLDNYTEILKKINSEISKSLRRRIKSDEV